MILELKVLAFPPLSDLGLIEGSVRTVTRRSIRGLPVDLQFVDHDSGSHSWVISAPPIRQSSVDKVFGTCVRRRRRPFARWTVEQYDIRCLKTPYRGL